MRYLALTLTLVLSAVSLTGCGGSSTANSSQAVNKTNIDGSDYVLAEEPEDAMGVIEARETAKNGDSVAIVGRIGGAANPWVEGRAAFILLDASMSLVANGTESGEKEICLEECCAKDRAACTTLVKVVDQSGHVLPVDARQLLGVKADDMVVVRGTVNKDENGNFFVLASGVHVRL